MFRDHFCRVPQCCLFVSGTPTHGPSFLSATSLFKLDLENDIDHYSHKRRESDDKNAVAIVKIVPQLGCVSQDSDVLVSH